MVRGDHSRYGILEEDSGMGFI